MRGYVKASLRGKKFTLTPLILELENIGADVEEFSLKPLSRYVQKSILF